MFVLVSFIFVFGYMCWLHRPLFSLR